MSTESTSTAPKPFVFVLMPFKPEFNDIYKYGIKGAAEDVGAYSERVDEQDYTESMLDRIYNQINKADVIVADMSGQNPNVFYEVGYAHALDKIVLLLTQDSNDIPFDLKHRPHIVYGGQIEQLRTKLAQKIRWAIEESKARGKAELLQHIGVTIQNVYIPEASTLEDAPIVELYTAKRGLDLLSLKILLHNRLLETIYGISHVYLFAPDARVVVPLKSIRLTESRRTHWRAYEPLTSASLSKKDLLPIRYRLSIELDQIPPDAVEEITVRLRFMVQDREGLDMILQELRENAPLDEVPLVLRIHVDDSVQDFPFRLKVTVLLSTPA